MISIYGDIILYSTDCPKCKVLKKKLLDKNISFTEVNSIDDMIALGIKQAPVLSNNGMLLAFKEAVDWVNKQ